MLSNPLSLVFPCLSTVWWFLPCLESSCKVSYGLANLDAPWSLWFLRSSHMLPKNQGRSTVFLGPHIFPLSSSKEQLSPIKMLGLGRGSGSHYLHCQADAEHTQSICAMNGHVWGFLQIPSLRLAPIWPQLCKHWGGDGIFWWERSMDLCFPNPESNKGKSVLRGYKRNPQANMHFPAP